MPDISGLTIGSLLPQYPLHFLAIIHYLTLLLIIFLIVAPTESGTLFTLLMGVTAILIVADLYSSVTNFPRFWLFMARLFAIVLPVGMAGAAAEKNIRELSMLVALLSGPGLVVLLFAPHLDPLV